jgi:hypothetical protein
MTTFPTLSRFAMSRDARLMAGITLITVPTIQYGGYFLLRSLMDKKSGYMDNPLRQNLFRAGHAHAGVIVLLSLICQLLVDGARLSPPLAWFVRIGVPLAAILLSLGFFLALPAPTDTVVSRAIGLVYAGAFVLAASVLTLGVGLIRS